MDSVNSAEMSVQRCVMDRGQKKLRGRTVSKGRH
jgi:hypothetical protein